MYQQKPLRVNHETLEKSAFQKLSFIYAQG